ncbi:MAG: hypothetical protein JXB48_21200 [Candidatus Latescibacteria bacterium]|nr:hypothetical protein [Candidatus Latescibacterota bacterium]
MKRFIFSALLMLAAISQLIAGVPTLATIDNIEFQLVASNQSGSTVDTMRLTGATSDTVLVKQSIEPGWSYVIVSTDSINAVTDSIQLRCIMYGTNRKTVMGNHLVGTDSTTAIYCHLLPIGVTAFGSCFSLRYTRAAATTKTAIYRWELWKVRKNSVNQDYNTRR